MDGIHDMGGMHGFGKVEPEPDEPVFHAEWEGRTLALNRAMGYTGIWTIDQTALRHRALAARPLSYRVLLQEMGNPAGEAHRRTWPRRCR